MQSAVFWFKQAFYQFEVQSKQKTIWSLCPVFKSNWQPFFVFQVVNLDIDQKKSRPKKCGQFGWLYIISPTYHKVNVMTKKKIIRWTLGKVASCLMTSSMMQVWILVDAIIGPIIVPIHGLIGQIDMSDMSLITLIFINKN